MVPVGLAGLATSTPASGFFACAARRLSPVMAKRVVGVGLDQHRLAAERRQDVAIRRIARIGDRHAVARLEHRQKRQDESGRRAGGHDHAVGAHRHAIGLGIVPRDARAQRRNAERLGVAQRALAEHGLHRRNRGRRRADRRLADLHVNDLAARRLDPGRRRHHVHHHERRHVAAGGRRHQRPRGIEHHGGLSTAIRRRINALPRCCRIRPLLTGHAPRQRDVQPTRDLGSR